MKHLRGLYAQTFFTFRTQTYEQPTYYGDRYTEREHWKYLVVGKRIILKLSLLGYGRCKVNRRAERGGRNIGVTLPVLQLRCQEMMGDEN
jgi:hypothetical protein